MVLFRQDANPVETMKLRRQIILNLGKYKNDEMRSFGTSNRGKRTFLYVDEVRSEKRAGRIFILFSIYEY